MQTHFLRTPLTAIALGVLLAACGGGGSSDTTSNDSKAVLSSPGTSSVTGTASASSAPSGTNTESTAASTGVQTANASSTATTTPKAGSVLSAKEVRGDLLASMLDSVPCPQDPSETSAVDGPAFPRADNTVSDSKVQFSLAPTNYTQNPDFNWPPNAILLTRPCKAFIYHPAGTGQYEMNVSSYAFSRTRPVKLDKGFNDFSIQLPVTISDSGLTIGREITMQTKRDLNPYPDAVQKTMTPERKDMNLTADTAFSFSLTSSTPLGGAVHEWKSGTDSVQLLLLPGQSNQAKVCWNVNTQLVKRLQCMVWQVPANWKRGQELESVDQYIVDDRSVYPNEQGMRYFRTAVQPD